MSCNAKREPNGTWRIQYRWTDWTGAKKKSQKRGFKTKKEAEEWYARFLLQQSSDPSMTLADFWEIYKADMEKRLRRTTMKQKEYMVNDKILPYFGTTPINEITAPMIRKWQGEMMKQGFKPTYLKTIHNQLSAIMNYAVNFYDLRSNPCKKAGSMGKSKADTGEYFDSFSTQEVKKLSLGIDTTISPGKITMQQWAMLFETNSNTQSAVLSEAIQSLRYQRKNGQTTYLKKAGEDIAQMQQQLSSVSKADTDFDVSLLPEQIAAESVSEPSRGTNYTYDTFKANSNSYLVQKVTYQLGNTNFLTFFSGNQQMNNLLDEIEDFIHTPNTSLYINTSTLGAAEGIGGMIIDLICNYIISQNNICPFVFFIDEVHRYTKSQYSENEFHNGLILVAREGRKKGIFLFLTTQNPQDVSPVLLGQVGTLLIHRLTHNDEIKSIQNHLDDYAVKQVKKLNQGEAVLTSVNLLHNLFVHVTKCGRKQYNETPML